jgi:lysophospholipase L1-like esterase
LKRFAVLTVAAAIVLSGCATQQPPSASTQAQKYLTDAQTRGVSVPASDAPQVGVLGDSYTTGTRLGGLANSNWTRVAQADLYAGGLNTDLSVSATGGAGYVGVGSSGTNFQGAASTVAGPRTKLVIVFGGRSDVRLASPAEVKAAAAKTYAELRKLAPGAKLLVVGPTWPNAGIPPKVSETRDAIRDAAAAAGAIFVDPLNEGWFSGNNAALIGDDESNPTDVGHAHMAKLLEPRIKAALGK